eukprot:9010385-Lingulodinium_polyedra.AAC.1
MDNFGHMPTTPWLRTSSAARSGQMHNETDQRAQMGTARSRRSQTRAARSRALGARETFH